MSDGPEASPARGKVLAGSAVYTSGWLSEYDEQVLDKICLEVWRCDRAELLTGYDRNIGERHLDLGPGTGFFLDNCRHRCTRPRIALVDLNPTVLAEASERLRRFGPVTVECDVLSPFELGGERFDSAGLNFLLHCLPGGPAHKARVFDHARAHVVPGGRIFGSTVLADGVDHSPEAHELLGRLNAMGAFDNHDDSFDALDAELANRFEDYRIVLRGSVAIFEATA